MVGQADVGDVAAQVVHLRRPLGPERYESPHQRMHYTQEKRVKNALEDAIILKRRGLKMRWTMILYSREQG
jgi:hypothetical protein